MTTTVRAVYQNGVLRPDRPLPLADGETVEVTVAPAPTDEDDVIRRVQAAKSLDEFLDVLKSLPPDDGGYDVLVALNENRIWSGERPLLPPAGPTE